MSNILYLDPVVVGGADSVELDDGRLAARLVAGTNCWVGVIWFTEGKYDLNFVIYNFHSWLNKFYFPVNKTGYQILAYYYLFFIIKISTYSTKYRINFVVF